MKASVFTALVLFATLAAAQVPIPSRPDGFSYNGGLASAQIQLDVFLDLLCPDSQAAYPVLKSVGDYYGPSTLNLNVHVFPLPYHHNAFYAAEASQIIAALAPSSVYKWFDAVYANMDRFENAATANLSSNQVIDLYASLAATVGVSSNAFKQAFANGTFDEDARVSWKYGCTRGVAGTPWFFINGINVAAQASWTLSDWQQVLGSLLSTSYKACDSNPARTRFGVTDCPSGETVCNFLPGQSQCCLKGESCIPNVGCRC